MRNLKKGDKFLLEKGMVVYAQIPKQYVYANRPFDKTLTEHDIIVDILYTNEEITKRNIKEEANHIANQVFKAFVNNGYHEIDFKDCKNFVNSHIDINKKLSLQTFKFKGGMFQVVKVALDGGGGLGYDKYPDGWHVWARRIVNEKLSMKKEDFINFYQYGYFSAVIKEVKIINNKT